jgi:hypothetical protein
MGRQGVTAPARIEKHGQLIAAPLSQLEKTVTCSVTERFAFDLRFDGPLPAFL